MCSVEIHEELEVVCGSSAIGYRRVDCRQWMQEFKDGRDTRDKPRPERPPSLSIADNINVDVDIRIFSDIRQLLLR